MLVGGKGYQVPQLPNAHITFHISHFGMKVLHALQRIVAQFWGRVRWREKVGSGVEIRASAARTLGGDVHTLAVCRGRGDQIRTIALRTSKAQITCRRLFGSPQFCLQLYYIYATAWHSKRLFFSWVSPTIFLYGWIFCRRTDGRICSQVLLSRRLLANESMKRW